ncbi:MAG TPA: NUDIX domain-containing protein [Niabella sp.]|nr:NUDIX domain-containing protein [Niabella sp.]
MKKYSAGFILKNGKILLGLRSKNKILYPDVWDFIGGNCEADESYEKALIREIKEEIGIDVLTFQKVFFIEQPDEAIGLCIFNITKWKGTIENKQSEEHQELGWFTFSELHNLKFPRKEYECIFKAIKDLCLTNPKRTTQIFSMAGNYI